MNNPNIRPASRNGNVVTIQQQGSSGTSEMIFCNSEGAAHYIAQREVAASNPAFNIKTKVFEDKE